MSNKTKMTFKETCDYLQQNITKEIWKKICEDKNLNIIFKKQVGFFDELLNESELRAKIIIKEMRKNK